MSNRYGLNNEALLKIRERDRLCVYCHKEMFKPSSDVLRNDWATIEHLNHNPPWDNHETVAICCGHCNSSRGKRSITDWFKSPYCTEMNINLDTVSEVVANYIRKYE